MIMEFTTESGTRFRLDNERMTWERELNGSILKGTLYDWPPHITVGKPVEILQRNPLTSQARLIVTTNVKEMKGHIPCAPEEIA